MDLPGDSAFLPTAALVEVVLDVGGRPAGQSNLYQQTRYL